MKKIIDVACGGKMFWFDKHNPNVEYCDIRDYETTLCDGRYFEVKPDTICDFTDPTGWQHKKYGALYANWQDMIQKGFKECFRVLQQDGILIFKWNETDIKVSEVLALTDQKPLFGHKSGKRQNTHWLCFMKLKEEL